MAQILERKYNDNVQYFHVSPSGSSIKDDMSLVDLGVGPNGAVQLEISSADPVSAPIKPPKPKPEYVMPDVITVRVERGKGRVHG